MKALKKGLVDTNILVHAANPKSPHHQSSQSFLSQQHTNSIIVTPQIFLEFFNVLKNLGSNTVSILTTINSLQNQTSTQIIHPLPTTYQKALNLAKKYNLRRKNQIFDAYLAATAIDNKIKIIYTQNTKDYPFKTVTPINPFK